jgi:tyrosyl-tRNA synthetase
MMNVESMDRQLSNLWTNVKCLGIKHQYPNEISRRRNVLNNRKWLADVSAVTLMSKLGSSMRLGPMLARDS